MEREFVLTVVATALFGVAVWLASLLASRLRARETERVAWWRLMFPLLAGAMVFAFLLGWALQEPDPADEEVGVVLGLLAVLTAGVAIRASLRSLTALRAGAVDEVPICTVGLFRPRPLVSEAFRRSVSEDVLAAALAHEAAHVQRRDPLRIWLAQLGADLQWPIPGAARRFSAWLLALEAERDDHAVASGVAEEDLAEAILAAVRLHGIHTSSICVNIEGAGEGIAWRVRRLLLGGSRGLPQQPTFSVAVGYCCALLSTAAWLGLHYGDAVLRVLPGVGP